MLHTQLFHTTRCSLCLIFLSWCTASLYVDSSNCINILSSLLITYFFHIANLLLLLSCSRTVVTSLYFLDLSLPTECVTININRISLSSAMCVIVLSTLLFCLRCIFLHAHPTHPPPSLCSFSVCAPSVSCLIRLPPRTKYLQSVPTVTYLKISFAFLPLCRSHVR